MFLWHAKRIAMAQLEIPSPVVNRAITFFGYVQGIYPCGLVDPQWRLGNQRHVDVTMRGGFSGVLDFESLT